MARQQFVVKKGESYARFSLGGSTQTPEVRSVSWRAGKEGLRGATRFDSYDLAALVATSLEKGGAGTTIMPL